METIYIGLGSNIDPQKNLRLAMREVRRRFDLTRQSSTYRSKAVGFDGDDFLNLVVEARTPRSPAEVLGQLDEIHELAGRKRGGPRFAAREIDIDLLLFGELCVEGDDLTVPRPDVLDYGFVLLPLCEIAPQLVHPVTLRTISDHCREFEFAGDPVRLGDSAI